MRLPDWATDWKVAFFAAERRLSPRLERAIRTDVFLDAMTVANSVSRLAQRSMDQLVETQQSARAGRDSTRPS
jgi:hypothetical protein